MTPADENPRDEAGKAVPDGPPNERADGSGSDLPLDEEAAWRAIVENYGERPRIGDPLPGSSSDGPPSGTSSGRSEPPAPAAPAAGVFDRSYLEAADARRGDGPDHIDSWADEGHFVPPEPPPIPRATPARTIAWLGLFGTPLLMLLAVIVGWALQPWAVLLFVVAFVGGFVVLVATMSRHDGDRDGDDGAVV